MAAENRVLVPTEAANVVIHRMNCAAKPSDVGLHGTPSMPGLVQKHFYRSRSSVSSPHPPTCVTVCRAAGVSVMSGDLSAANFLEAHVRLARKCLLDPALRVLAAQHPEWTDSEARQHLQGRSLAEVTDLARQATPSPPSLMCFTRQGPPHVPRCGCADGANECSRLVYAPSADQLTFNDHLHYHIQPERSMSLEELNAMATCQVRSDPPTADDWQRCPVLPVAFRAAADVASDFSDLPPAPPGILDAIQAALTGVVDVYIERPANQRVFSLEDIFYAMYMAICICRQPWTFCGLTPDAPEWLDETVDLQITIPRPLAELLYRCIRGGYGMDDRDPAFRGVAQLVADMLLIGIEYVQPFAADPPEPDGFVVFGDDLNAPSPVSTGTNASPAPATPSTQTPEGSVEWDSDFLTELLSPCA